MGVFEISEKIFQALKILKYFGRTSYVNICSKMFWRTAVAEILDHYQKMSCGSSFDQRQPSRGVVKTTELWMFSKKSFRIAIFRVADYSVVATTPANI